MSASDKKKLRKEQESAALTDKQLAQQKEDKQLKLYTRVFAAVMALVVLIAAVSMGINWYKNSGTAARNTIALTVGDSQLTNADLNFYFIDTVSDFYDNAYASYSNYASLYVKYLYGLDMSVALNLQVYDEETGDTWADYFLDSAISSAKATYALYNLAIAEGFELNDEYKAELAAALNDARTNASYFRYSSLDGYLEGVYGSGANTENFTNYLTVNCIADAYYSAYADTLTYTQEQIDEYNKNHYNEFSTFDFSTYYINVNNYLPKKEAEKTEGSDKNATVTYTDAEKEAARAAAESDANLLSKLDSAAGISKEYGKLTGNPTSSSNLTKQTMNNLNNLYKEWLMDQAREPGDTIVVASETTSKDTDGKEVKTVNGYYVVLFEGREDYLDNMIDVRHILVKFEGGKQEKDENGNTTTVYSEEEKKAAYDKAEAILNEWKNGAANEESFAALANEKSQDPGSNKNGGLYENVFDGYMLKPFNDWCFDESREAGDTGIVETEHGYHIMFFSAHCDQNYRDFSIEYTLRSTDANAWYEEILKGVTATEGNTEYIYKGLVIAPTSAS